MTSIGRKENNLEEMELGNSGPTPYSPPPIAIRHITSLILLKTSQTKGNI